jgi:hypothetical protein
VSGRVSHYITALCLPISHTHRRFKVVLCYTNIFFKTLENTHIYENRRAKEKQEMRSTSDSSCFSFCLLVECCSVDTVQCAVVLNKMNGQEALREER